MKTAMHKWDILGAGWVAYLSPTGSNEAVRVLKITPKLKEMPRRPRFIGWFSKGVSEDSVPTNAPWELHSPTLLNSPEYLEEMRVIKHGLLNIMGMFGETDVVLYFRDSKSPTHHAHVHVSSRALYKSQENDVDLDYILGVISAEVEILGTATIDHGAEAIERAIREAENAALEAKAEKERNT